MKLQVLFRACNKVISRANPEARVKTDTGDVVTCKELSKELENLEHWCYKGEIDVQKVIRCKNCKHYKRYRKKNAKNPYEHTVFYACSLSKEKRNPEFFCSDGEEKD